MPSVPKPSSPGPALRDSADLARRVLETEARAILGLIPQLDDAFDRALDLLCESTGRVIVTGMGKSGIIARKLSATLSSTGTSAFFLHPAEAIHGDLGMVRAEDTIVALSYSGETAEILRLVEAIRRTGAKLIAFTGQPQSSLGQTSDVTLRCHVAEEACPMNLAPTASTTAMLALGDALAMALARRKGFREEQFANLHPGGRIGKKLMRVESLMHAGDSAPIVAPDTPMKDVLYEISKKGLGMACVVDPSGRLLGIVTDGDLRRHMERESNLLDRCASDVMTSRPVTIARSLLAVEALRQMEERKITSVVVVDSASLVEGVVHLHDLWRTQMI